MVGCDATGQSAPHKVRVRPALTDRRSLPRPLRPQQPAGLPGIAQSLREWVGFRSRLHHQYQNPNRSRLGFFLARSRRFPRVVGGSCGSLRTSPAARTGRSRPHSTISWRFLAPTSLPETGPKSAKATSLPPTDQRVTRGRIKRLDCSIGWRRKRCGCVLSVVVELYRHVATRMGCTGMADGRDRLSGHRPDNYNKAIQDQSGGAP